MAVPVVLYMGLDPSWDSQRFALLAMPAIPGPYLGQCTHLLVGLFLVQL